MGYARKVGVRGTMQGDSCSEQLSQKEGKKERGYHNYMHFKLDEEGKKVLLNFTMKFIKPKEMEG